MESRFITLTGGHEKSTVIINLNNIADVSFNLKGELSAAYINLTSGKRIDYEASQEKVEKFQTLLESASFRL